MDSRPPLWKQLLGAVLGAVVALLLYEAYSVTSPVITAWVVAPQSQINAQHPGQVRVNEQVGEYSFNRMAARAKEIYQRFAAEQGPQAAVMPKGIEVTQSLPEQGASSIAFIAITGLSSSSSVSSSSEAVSSSSEASEEAQIVAAISTEGYASSASSRATVARSVEIDVSVAQAEKLAGKNLPSSGLGTTLAAALALGAAAGLQRKKKRSK